MSKLGNYGIVVVLNEFMLLETDKMLPICPFTVFLIYTYTVNIHTLYTFKWNEYAKLIFFSKAIQEFNYRRPIESLGATDEST